MSPAVAYLAWVPIAAAVLTIGCHSYAARFLPAGWGRLAAVAIAAFGVSLTAPLVHWTGLGSEEFEGGTGLMAAELFTAGALWGYLPTAIAVGLMPLFLLGAEKSVAAGDGSARRHLAWTAAAGMAVSFLHPWQGVTLIVVVAAVAAWGRLARPLLRLAVPAVATLLPLVYYQVLARTDPAWEYTQQASQLPHLRWWFFAGLAPLALPAALGLGRPRDVGERMLLIWPLAGVAVYLGLRTSFFYHALEGLAVPLAVLSVRGWARLRLPRVLGVAAVALATVPGLVYWGESFRDSLGSLATTHFLQQDERRALSFLEQQPVPGGVVTGSYLGQAVPAYTGRPTWVGHPTWTPDYGSRAATAEALLNGRLGRPEVMRLLEGTRARFVLADCRGRPDIAVQLGRLLRSTRVFGCARVYELRPVPP